MSITPHIIKAIRNSPRVHRPDQERIKSKVPRESGTLLLKAKGAHNILLACLLRALWTVHYHVLWVSSSVGKLEVDLNSG